MYSWMVYLHVLATFAFIMTHGVSSLVALRLRSMPDPATARAWLTLYANNGVFGVLYGSLLTLLATGIISGFMGNWWGQAWIWLALVLLTAIIVSMYLIDTWDYSRVRKALGMVYIEGMKEHPAGEQASAEEIEALLAESPAILLTVIGSGGIAVILWLMMFKPF